MRIRGFTLIELIVVVGIIFVLAMIGADSYGVEIPARLLTGWYSFMVMNAQSLQPNPLLIMEALVCTALLGVGSHYFCRWLWVKATPERTEVWRVRWTVTGLAGVLLLFVAGIATIGITHQTAWLFTMKGPMIIDSWGPRFQLPEALKSAAPAREAVEAYFARTGVLPDSARDAGIDEKELVTQKVVKAIHVAEGGVVVIELQHRSAPDGVILFTPNINGKALEWKCTSNLERIYLPRECRP